MSLSLPKIEGCCGCRQLPDEVSAGEEMRFSEALGVRPGPERRRLGFPYSSTALRLAQKPRSTVAFQTQRSAIGSAVMLTDHLTALFSSARSYFRSLSPSV
jgi:hypothetical protein